MQKNEINEERAVQDERMHTLVIEGRNAVLEAFRSGKPIDKVFVLDGCQDGPVRTIVREAKKHDTILNFVGKDRLNQISQTGRHQGVIAYAAAYDYATVEDMLALAKERGEDPFLVLLDNIEDPHNLGSDHPDGESRRSARCDYTETPGSRFDSDRGENLGGGAQLYAGGESDQSGEDDGGTERKRTLVCLCGYGRRIHVPLESDRTDRSCDRK